MRPVALTLLNSLPMTLSIVQPLPTNTAPPSELSRIRQALAGAPLFQALTLDAVEDLTRRLKTRRVGAQTTVVSQGDTADGLYLIASGRVKVVIFGQNGREVTLSILKDGDSFGEISLFDGDNRSADCIALEPTELLVLSREDLLEHLLRHPGTAVNLLSQMAKRLRKADQTIAQLALHDVHERLEWQLIALAQEEGSQVSEGLLVRRRPTQQELANMIGSCRETISRAFNQLARDGLILSRGRAMVVTQALLQKNRKNDAV